MLNEKSLDENILVFLMRLIQTLRIPVRVSGAGKSFRALGVTMCFLACLLLPGCGRNQNVTLPDDVEVTVQGSDEAVQSGASSDSAQGASSATGSSTKAATDSGTEQGTESGVSASGDTSVSAGTTLTVTAMKAGAADAFVLMTDDHVTIIDTGLEKKADKLVDFLVEQGVTRVDEMIITHFDKDHVGGADHILNEFEVGTVYTTYQSKESDDISAYMAALAAAGMTETVVSDILSYEADGVTFTIYPPQSEIYADKTSNNSSLVVKVSVGENSMLFAGDAETERLKELLGTEGLECTILKVPHHGRYSPNTKAFIDYVSPKYAIITSSNSEPEDPEVMNILSSAGVETYLTRDGTIAISITESDIVISQ